MLHSWVYVVAYSIMILNMNMSDHVALKRVMRETRDEGFMFEASFGVNILVILSPIHLLSIQKHDHGISCQNPPALRCWNNRSINLSTDI